MVGSMSPVGSGRCGMGVSNTVAVKKMAGAMPASVLVDGRLAGGAYCEAVKVREVRKIMPKESDCPRSHTSTKKAPSRDRLACRPNDVRHRTSVAVETSPKCEGGHVQA